MSNDKLRATLAHEFSDNKRVEEAEVTLRICRLLQMTRDEYTLYQYELACEWIEWRKIGRLKNLDKCFIVSNTFHEWFKAQLTNINKSINDKFRLVTEDQYRDLVYNSLRFYPSVGVWDAIMMEGTGKLKSANHLTIK